MEGADTTPYTTAKDAVDLLRSASTHLDDAMRLLAEATLLKPELDESLGIEAQRLIGVLAAVREEIRTLDRNRLCEMEQ